MNRDQQAELVGLIGKYSSGEGICPTAISGLDCVRFSAPTARMPTVYNPSICVVVQGAKKVMLGDEIFQYVPSEFLVVSLDLPVVGQVTEASAAKPYLCLQIDIEPRHLSDLITLFNRRELVESAEECRGLFVGKIDSALLDSVLRLTRLLKTPKDIPLLAPMAMREIYYRLLDSEHGQRISQIAIAGTHIHRIAHVVHRLKTNFEKPVGVDELAEMANMSPSSFHAHFKEVTAMSPLQYQKRLRLVEARRIMLAEQADASTAAHRVGYESPSQFSREYSRMFGAPPARDIKSLRQSH